MSSMPDVFSHEREMFVSKYARFDVRRVGVAGPPGSGRDRILVMELEENVQQSARPALGVVDSLYRAMGGLFVAQ